VELAGYAVLDNHLHVVQKLNDEMAAGWSGEDIILRWGSCFNRDKTIVSRLTIRKPGALFGEGCAAVTLTSNGWQFLFRIAATDVERFQVVNVGPCALLRQNTSQLCDRCSSR
jgi:hypothetical protein